MNDLVSVVFPVGPGVASAREALDDLLGQTWQNLEIIAVLNGCLPEVREEFLVKKDERLRVLDLGEEPQLLPALNLAIRESRGKWLARMDSDDRCSATRIEKQLELLQSVDVVTCEIELVGALGDGMQRYVDWVNNLEDPAKERFVESPVVQPTVMMSKELFLKVGGYLENGFAEDYDLWLRLLARGARFGRVPEKLYRWHDRNDRLTRSDPRFGHKQMLALKAARLADLPEVMERGVVVAGAGPIGKVLARELLSCGVEVYGFFEVSPKRIGSTCQDRPIVSNAELGKVWESAILLSAVGVSGGRDKVRAVAETAGYEEGEDFWCCC